MKKFIIRSGLFFIAALIITALVFYVVSRYSKNTTVLQSKILKETVGSSTVEKGTSSAVTAIPQEGILLRTLTLSDDQKSLLSKVGIDVNSFVITKTMLSCAEDTIGADRVAAIKKGTAPSLVETTRLLPCLTS